MTNLETISKRRSISLHTKKHIYKLVKLSILLYGCEFWTISKNLEVLRIGFETKASGNFWREIHLHKKENQQVCEPDRTCWISPNNNQKRKLNHYGYIINRARICRWKKKKRMTEEKWPWESATLSRDRRQWREMCSIAANRILLRPTGHRIKNKGFLQLLAVYSNYPFVPPTQ